MARLVNVEDYRRLAGRRLPKVIFDYLEGGALDEVTLRSNVEDLQRLRLRQTIMRDVSAMDLGVTVLGHPIRTPVLISPMGLLTLFCRDADVAMARAAQRAGTIFVHSAWSGTPLREVAAAAPGAVWAQLSLWKDEGLVQRHIERAKAAGVDVLVIAGDVSVSSKRERDLHNGFRTSVPPSVASALDALRRPRWLTGFLFGPKVTFGDQSLEGRPMSLAQMQRFMHEYENDAMTWRDVERIRGCWDGKLVIKGVMSAGDAELARDAGVDAVFVSNHGGRQFDAQPSTTASLEAIADAVGDDVEILIDGGIRRGGDVAKLMALGATACLVGRPAVYGAVAAGQRGVAAILDCLTEEAAVALAFTGATSFAELGPEALVSSATGTSATRWTAPASRGEDGVDHRASPLPAGAEAKQGRSHANADATSA